MFYYDENFAEKMYFLILRIYYIKILYYNAIKEIILKIIFSNNILQYYIPIYIFLLLFLCGIILRYSAFNTLPSNTIISKLLLGKIPVFSMSYTFYVPFYPVFLT